MVEQTGRKRKVVYKISGFQLLYNGENGVLVHFEYWINGPSLVININRVLTNPPLENQVQFII